MHCPYCRKSKSKVVDSRNSNRGEEIRRRRYCDPQEGGCGAKFTTFERVERKLPMVVKRNGVRVPYDREKVRNGILRAASKRRIQGEEVERFLDGLEGQLAEKRGSEVRSREIGRAVLDYLRKRDQVAYIRFMSVYGDFQSVSEFQSLVREISERRT